MIGGLYVITDDALLDGRMGAAVRLALEGGARLVQYRSKDRSRERYRLNAIEVAACCRDWGAPLIVNDDPHLACEVGASGVHIGSGDPDLPRVRRLIGARRKIGVSCYNDLARARLAEEQGCNYVAFGSFHPSATKPKAVRASTALLRRARAELRVPIVAIGGITPENAPALVRAGAHAIAVVTAVFGDDDIATAAASFARIFRSQAECEDP